MLVTLAAVLLVVITAWLTIRMAEAAYRSPEARYAESTPAGAVADRPDEGDVEEPEAVASEGARAAEAPTLPGVPGLESPSREIGLREEPSTTGDPDRLIQTEVYEPIRGNERLRAAARLGLGIATFAATVALAILGVAKGLQSLLD